MESPNGGVHKTLTPLTDCFFEVIAMVHCAVDANGSDNTKLFIAQFYGLGRKC